MIRKAILNEMLVDPKLWKMRPTDLKKSDVTSYKGTILDTDVLWKDLEAHGITDSVSIDELRRKDPTSYEHAITNFWMTIWMIVNGTTDT